MSAFQAGVPSSAFAAAPDVAASSACEGADQVVTWSVTGSESPADAEHAMTIVSITSSSGSVDGLAAGDLLAPGETSTASTTLPGTESGSIVLTVITTFGGGVEEPAGTATAALSGDCETPTPSAEPSEITEPTTEPSAEVTPTVDPSADATPTVETTATLVSKTQSPRRSKRLAASSVEAQAMQAPVGLGTAGSFAVLSGESVTNTGPTVIEGNVGVHPGSSVTGFPPGIITSGNAYIADAVAQQAQTDRNTAFDDAAGRASDAALPPDLGGLTLVPGVYTSGSSAQLTGTLTLDAQGDPSAVWIFQIGSTLVTASSSNVSLINGASPCNVFWQVGSSATLGTSSHLVGTILAAASITLTTGATLEGRALAGNGSVTLDTNTISTTACSAAPPPSPTPTVTTSSTATPTVTTSPSTTPSGSVRPTSSGTGEVPSPPTAAPSDVPIPTITDAASRPTADGGSANPGDGGRHPRPLTGVPVTGGPEVPWLSSSFAADARSTMTWLTSLLPWLSATSMPLPDNQARAFGPARPPAALVQADLPLRAPAIAVPLRLSIPVMEVRARVLGVGMTDGQTMDAPMGAPDAPVWSKAFWYRGGGIPGDPGTATIAGHVSGGIDPVFANLERLRRGDDIFVTDRKTGHEVRFVVTGKRMYALDEIGPAQLRRIYGAGPVEGRRARETADGKSRLTLITCAGDRLASGYGHRLAVFAERASTGSGWQ